VGFGASLGAEWEPQLLESSDITLYWGQASIYSLGSISDGFVSLLNAVYGLGLSVHSMREHTKCLAVGLRSDPRELPSRPISMKLMFEHDEEERYAECYLNIDVEGQRVEFNEKDQDYRVPLLQCLSGVP